MEGIAVLKITQEFTTSTGETIVSQLIQTDDKTTIIVSSPGTNHVLQDMTSYEFEELKKLVRHVEPAYKRMSVPPTK